MNEIVKKIIEVFELLQKGPFSLIDYLLQIFFEMTVVTG